MENKHIVLSSRLSAAASYIRPSSIFADIGTDHAFLPIYAVETGLAVRAYAADINQMPLARAMENISAHGLESRVTCVLTSGFDALDACGITDAAVCGMGGELIADIILRAGFIRSDGFRLVIQPMTKHDAARRALWDSGFLIISELTVCEEGKYYTVICADYTGCTGKAARAADDFTAFYGDFRLKKFESENVRREYLEHEISKYNGIIRGKDISGADTSDERAIVMRLSELLADDRVVE